jgi:3-deoxy-7-phosphoheptulonate synthase
MLHRTDDVRIKWTKVVLPPVFLEEEMAMTERASSTIVQARAEISDIFPADSDKPRKC